MKVGSIVVVLPLPKVVESVAHLVKWLPVSDENTPYMVRSIFDDKNKDVLVTLEEGIVGYNTDGIEFGIPIEYFREILPPEDLTELIEECCCVPVGDKIRQAIKRMEIALDKIVRKNRQW